MGPLPRIVFTRAAATMVDLLPEQPRERAKKLAEHAHSEQVHLSDSDVSLSRQQASHHRR
jgi:hypothetical protein